MAEPVTFPGGPMEEVAEQAAVAEADLFRRGGGDFLQGETSAQGEHGRLAQVLFPILMDLPRGPDQAAELVWDAFDEAANADELGLIGRGPLGEDAEVVEEERGELVAEVPPGRPAF